MRTIPVDIAERLLLAIWDHAAANPDPEDPHELDRIDLGLWALLLHS